MIIDQLTEIRNLTKEELYRLLNEAPDTETRFLRQMQINTGRDIYDFFNRDSEEICGLVIDGRPIYIAAVMLNKEGRHIFWTVVNSNVKHKITLSNSVRRNLKNWLEKFGTLYATMGKDNKTNMRWVEWLGFNMINEDEDTITYKIGV